MRRGRPLQGNERHEERVSVYFKKSQLEELQSKIPGDMSTYLRKLALGLTSPDAFTGTDQLRLPFLTKAPCGPWEEAINYAEDIVISESMARVMDAREDDVVVGAFGESLEGRGIPDGAFLVMRPLLENHLPRRNEIVLVQAETDDGQCVGTIKTWCGGNPPRLEDGDGKEFALPENTVKVTPIAEARAMITKL